ncbi:uncharacterized protein LOC135346993 isoform X5 [Halichondria panicea]|uniref:uncharacterized protein LOC135346993 isoform X5 n=1 Tax=Halichondria panicea TaxID=6063 RepID=UPI00312B7075
MKDGYVILRNINLLLMGAAGSGKSATKNLLLGNPPSEVRNSTPCRDRIAHVRPVTNLLFQGRFQGSDNKWEEVSEEDLVNMLAKAIQHLPQSSRDKLPSDLQTRLKELSTEASTSAATEATSIPPSQESVSPVQQAIEDVVALVVEAMVSTPSQQEASISSTEGKELFGTKTMRVTDNGGQPQFHDVAPLFIRHASAGLFVSRLTDDFADYPHDDLYKDGKPVGPSSPSHLSYLETNMSLLRSFLSCKRDGKTPRPIFVGTFSDKIKDQKVIDKKNQALLDALPPELKEEVIYSNLPLKQVIFTVNACSRDENAQEVAKEIRKAVENSPTFDLKVPLWWFILELALQKLCKIMKRGILSKSECIALAQQLGFHPSALDAALDYFNDMCIVHYYPHILPHTVFVDPQVPLDKVSELTQHAVSLRDQRKRPSAKAAKWLKFRDQGIFTIDMLESEEFQKHYEDGLFTPADMIAIMMELLIIAPLTIPLLGRVDCSFSQVEFLMPSLLRSVPPSELEDHRVFTSSADPLLIRFVSGCIRCGVFCCLVVFLMKKCGWIVCLPSGKPVLLARNCVKFRLPDSPGSVTLIDSFSYMEVHVKARPHVLLTVCPLVRASVLEGVDAASDALHYNNDKPVISIFCPHEGATQQGKRHFADIHLSTKLWCCSEDFDLDGDLKTSHTVWLGTAIIPAEGALSSVTGDMSTKMTLSDQQQQSGEASSEVNTERKRHQLQYSVNQCGTLANVVSSTGSGMSDQQPCLSEHGNSVMEDVCLKTEVHDHDQCITSDKLSPAMEHVVNTTSDPHQYTIMEDVCKKTGVRDQQLDQEILESDIILIAEKFPHLLNVHKALIINDLQHVYEKLHKSASPHWFNLGLALGLTHPDLTNINIKCREDNVLCLREMLAKLLSTQHVTWSLLSDALRRPTVDLINLADSITGKPSSATGGTCTERKSDQQQYSNTAADVTEGDTSQDVLTSYPHTIPSGAGGPRTVTIEELKERTQMRYPDDDDDDDSSDSWHSTNESVEHHPIDEVVDTVDTPSDVTDPDTLINEQSFSQASPVEHHPTASDEATCTTALQSTHRTDQHTTASTVLTDAVPSDVTKGDTSQDVLTSYPHTIPSGADGPRTVTIEELKERTKVTDSQLDTEIEETDMIVLAAHFDNVDTYAVQLGLDPSERRDVKITASNYDTRTAIDKALRLWRQHNPGAATYRALVKMLLRMGKETLAFKMCQTAATKHVVCNRRRSI